MQVNSEYFEAMSGENGNGTFINYFIAVIKHAPKNHKEHVYFKLIIALIENLIEYTSTENVALFTLVFLDDWQLAVSRI
ncbi:hypothetical protein [Vibrio campbellii]|uniref:Uncharacterized protein n=1 Tax=Vibrio campbellii TaxID=680 RepID=A0ABY5IKP9_9VIBR|nr:hypothetical protein [Vibrio campbellii]UTZ23738.1 hypothetical protein HB760_18280 [Vibrio campbellii]UTZ34125.1 hypothetical protein HB762_23170 [Vibrio campbellii]